MLNKKKYLFVICEGESAKTEKNYLNNFFKDSSSFLKVNHKWKQSSINFFRQKNISMECHPINHSDLKIFLDAKPEAYSIIVFVDRDITGDKNPFEKVKKIVKKYNDNNKVKLIFAHPSPGMAFEELLSFYFEKPESIYKVSNKLGYKGIKCKLGEKYKGDSNIYRKLLKKGKTDNLLKNLGKYRNRTMIHKLVKWKEPV